MATFGNVNVSGGTTVVGAPPAGDKAVSKFVLDRQGLIDHMLFFGGSISGPANALIYDDTGAGGLPGALLGVSATVPTSAGNGGPIAYSFSSLGLVLNPGSYWVGLLAAAGGSANCGASSNGIAFNSNAGSASNPFGASPSLANFVYPLVVFYTPALPAGTAYGQLIGGDLTHQYTANYLTLLQITIPVAGTISKLTTFLQNTYGSANCKGLVYDDSGAGGAPGNLLGSTSQLTGPAINGNDLIFSSAIAAAPGDYWIGLQTDTQLNTWHLNDSNPNYITPASYGSGVPGTFPLVGSTANTGSWPLWATFAATAAGSADAPQIICCT